MSIKCTRKIFIYSEMNLKSPNLHIIPELKNKRRNLNHFKLQGPSLNVTNA